MLGMPRRERYGYAQAAAYALARHKELQRHFSSWHKSTRTHARRSPATKRTHDVSPAVIASPDRRVRPLRDTDYVANGWETPIARERARARPEEPCSPREPPIRAEFDRLPQVLPKVVRRRLRDCDVYDAWPKTISELHARATFDDEDPRPRGKRTSGGAGV